MKNFFRKIANYYLLGGVIFGLTMLLACDDSKSSAETPVDTTAVPQEREEPPTSASPEDKSQRASLPDSLKVVVGNINLQIYYSRPSVKERKVWGELVPYGEVWRTGANEATVFQIDKDIFVEGQTLHAGKYALFTIPGEEEWTVIFSNNPDQWGAFKYTQSEDALRVQVKPKTNTEHTENLTFRVISEEKHLADILLEWEKLQIPIHIREPF